VPFGISLAKFKLRLINYGVGYQLHLTWVLKIFINEGEVEMKKSILNSVAAMVLALSAPAFADINDLAIEANGEGMYTQGSASGVLKLKKGDVQASMRALNTLEGLEITIGDNIYTSASIEVYPLTGLDGMSYTVATFSNIPEICENGEIEFKGHIGIMPQYYMSAFSGSIWSDSVDCRLNEEGTLKGNYSLSGSVEDVELKLPALYCPAFTAEDLLKIGALPETVGKSIDDAAYVQEDVGSTTDTLQWIRDTLGVWHGEENQYLARATVQVQKSTYNGSVVRLARFYIDDGIQDEYIERIEVRGLSEEEYQACRQLVIENRVR
jgi:hypothetical protein